jgi:hypothetical protein
MLCSKCQKQESEGWPDGTTNPGGELCQVCWEDQCDKSWWAMMKALDEAGIPVEDL